MGLEEFEALDEHAQANAVWDGKFVSSRVVDDVFIQLYNLDGLLVEVYYDPMRNKITHFHRPKMKGGHSILKTEFEEPNKWADIPVEHP